MTAQRKTGFRVLDWIEWAGNALPDPATLFLLATIVVMIVSHLGQKQGWAVKEVLPHRAGTSINAGGGTGATATGTAQIEWRQTGKAYTATSLLTSDGLFWALRSMVENFMKFPPLGIVLTAMLGIGVAERTGLIGAALKAFMLVMPRKLLTPAIIFVGVNSSIASDAGYVVLPPLAAVLFQSVGRSPLVGIAAVFAGVAGGFGANLAITGGDALLAGLTEKAANILDPAHRTIPLCNWYFMIASTFLLTFFGWWVTERVVEPRLAGKSPEEGGPVPPQEADLASQRLCPDEVRGLGIAIVVLGLALALFVAIMLIPGAPLYGRDEKNVLRWVQPIVPILFIVFLLPGIVYGIVTRQIRNDKDAARLLAHSMAGMAPIIVLAFFAAQFLEHFRYSGLDKMLALSGGQLLARAGLPTMLLIVGLILLTLVFNLFIGSASAKWSLLAPILVPMLMMVGVSPELTQATYRVGDSVTNTITPLNAYLLIVLVVMQKYVPRSGMGTLIATMVPYSIVFAIAWTVLLLAWIWLDLPLGVQGYLTYPPPGS